MDLSKILQEVEKKYIKAADDVYVGEKYFDESNLQFISTGHILLDIYLSNRPYGQGGIPLGRILEFYGNESSGKSLLSLYVAKNVLKEGGIVLYFDIEQTLSKDYLIGMGLYRHIKEKGDNWRIYQSLKFQYLETFFDFIDEFLQKKSEVAPEIPGLIVYDSLTAGIVEGEDGYKLDGYGVKKAKVLSNSLRQIPYKLKKANTSLIFINQTRDKIGVMFGDTKTTSGGNALKFYSSVRLYTKKIKDIKGKDKDELKGQTMRVKVVKNKITAPRRQVDIDVIFSLGINPYSGLLEGLTKYKIVKRSGGWYKLDYQGKELKFQGENNFIKELFKNEELAIYLANTLYEEIKFEYENSKELTDDDRRNKIIGDMDSIEKISVDNPEKEEIPINPEFDS